VIDAGGEVAAAQRKVKPATHDREVLRALEDSTPPGL
jgi:peroxiredoxin